MRSSEAAMGMGGAQRPVLRDNELTKTGARSARASTRGQNPLVVDILFILLSLPDKLKYFLSHKYTVCMLRSVSIVNTYLTDKMEFVKDWFISPSVNKLCS
jgi:hypothetical protein